MMRICGLLVDGQGRCVHYHSLLDVVAIQFKCCYQYYACHLCHAKSQSHDVMRWGMADLEQPAVLCGVCKNVLTIADYLGSEFACPWCGSAFNPGCATHYDLYFDLHRAR